MWQRNVDYVCVCDVQRGEVCWTEYGSSHGVYGVFAHHN